MNKNRYLIQKISNLIISIEILNLYSKKYLNKNINLEIEKIVSITNSKIILNHYLQINLIDNLIYISNLYCLINNKHLQKIANKIIKEYKKNKKSILIKQYLYKFYYIYNKINDYYDYFNHNNKHIYEISVINLYIINEINKPKGLFFFIKYLFNNKDY